MKRLQLLWGLPVVLPAIAMTSPAMAQCVVADVAIQAAITGAQQPAEQSNNVEIDTGNSCVGNTSVSTSRQVQVGGTGPVRQTRQSRHRLQSTSETPTNANGPTVAVPVEVQVDVYNPAERLRQ